MKAYEIRGAFGLENLLSTERPDPKPGAKDVVVRVRAASLNYRDVLMARGQYNPRQKLPLIPLSDGAGEVIAVGPETTRVKVGDRVAGTFFQGFISRDELRDVGVMRRTLGGPLDGMLAELISLSEDGVVRVPPHLSDVEAATLPCAGLTAWSCLVSQASLVPGATVVVQGTGGVALFALQLAHSMGMRTIVLSSSAEKLERARRLGADLLINYKEKPGWGKEVRALTDGIGADLVLEIGGIGTLAQSIQAVRAGGQISLIGMLAGGQGELNIVPLFMSNIRLQGVLVGSRTEFEAMNRALVQSAIRPVVDREFPFSESRAAFEYFAEGKHIGKVCIRLDA